MNGPDPASGPASGQAVDPGAVASISARLAVIHDRIRSAGGDPDRIKIVAVTKAFGPDVLREALAAGLTDIGESYAQELIDKIRSLEPGGLPGPELPGSGLQGARVHFVGRLQRNKVRRIAPFVHLWQSVDRAELGDEIARRAPGTAVLVQVNSTGEAHKGGCCMDDVQGLVGHLREQGLDVRGLMTVGRAGDSEATRQAFRQVAVLADDLDLMERSMGMSDDLELAVEEGTTMVRIGRDLFGPRPRSDGHGGTDPGRRDPGQDQGTTTRTNT